MKKAMLAQTVLAEALALGLSPAMQAYMGMTMMADEAEDEFDDEALALLDKTLDEIEDLPGFEVPSNGRYLLRLQRAIKTIKTEGKQPRAAVEIGMEVMECLKKDNDSDPDSIPGTKFSQLSFLQGEDEGVRISIGMLKQFCKPIGVHFEEPNLKLIIKNHIPDLLISATVARRADKQNPEIFRARLSNVQVEAG